MAHIRKNKKLEAAAMAAAKAQFPAETCRIEPAPDDSYAGEVPARCRPDCGAAVIIFPKSFVMLLRIFDGGLYQLALSYPPILDRRGGVIEGTPTSSLSVAGAELFAGGGVPGRPMIAPFFGLEPYDPQPAELTAEDLGARELPAEPAAVFEVEGVPAALQGLRPWEVVSPYTDGRTGWHIRDQETGTDLGVTPFGETGDGGQIFFGRATTFFHWFRAVHAVWSFLTPAQRLLACDVLRCFTEAGDDLPPPPPQPTPPTT